MKNFYKKIIFFILKKIISPLIKSKIIFFDMHNDQIKFFSKKHIIYILPKRSILDLLILQIECERLGLPDPLNIINIKNFEFPRYIFSYNEKEKKTFLKKQTIAIEQFLVWYRLNTSVDIHVVPTFITFKCSHKKNSIFNKIKILTTINNFLSIVLFSGNKIIYFSNPISMYHLINRYENNEFIIKNFNKFINIYFFRIKVAFFGFRTTRSRNFFNKFLSSKKVKKFIERNVKLKKVKFTKVEKNIISLIKEISSNFSYIVIGLTEKIICLLYKKIYSDLCIYNIEKIKKLSINGHKIIYLPCHRSHMDYILISYVLYKHMLALPYIAAGNNLNFFPVGCILKRLGAFFISRTFNKKQIHSIVFKEYFNILLNNRYPIEYFVEGGRSRTGKLLQPRTGTLSLTIKMMIQNKKLTSLVPIYIGYENMIEMKTYIRELYGFNKKKESIWSIIRFFLHIKNFGKSYINFGNPISLSELFQIEKKNKILNSECIFNSKKYLLNIVNKVAKNIMECINESVVVNPISICSIIFLSTHKFSLNRNILFFQISCYINLLRNVPYSRNIKIPIEKPNSLLRYVLKIYKLKINKKNKSNPTFYLSSEQSKFLFYYRNNIQHLFIFPSLIAIMTLTYPGIHKKKLIKNIISLYPFIKEEFFINRSENQLVEFITKLIQEMIILKLVIKRTSFLYTVKENIQSLIILANSSKEILQKYAITFFLLKSKDIYSMNTLKEYSKILTILLRKNENNSIELFDKSTFKILIKTLRCKRYINKYNKIDKKKIKTIWKILNKIIPFQIVYEIKSNINNL